MQTISSVEPERAGTPNKDHSLYNAPYQIYIYNEFEGIFRRHKALSNRHKLWDLVNEIQSKEREKNELRF